MADEVDCFLDLADRFQARLADLDQASDREVPLALFEHVGAGAKQRNTALPTQIAPGGIGGARRFHGFVDQRGIGLRKFAEEDVAVDRAARVEHPPFIAVPAGDQRGPAPAEQPRLRLGNDGVEVGVNSRKILAGVRVSDSRQVVHFRGSSSWL